MVIFFQAHLFYETADERLEIILEKMKEDRKRGLKTV